MEEDNMIAAAIQSVAPFIIDLGTNRLTQQLPADHPLQQPLRDAGNLATTARLFNRNEQGEFTINNAAIERLSEHNNGAQGISLLSAIAPVMNTIANNEQSVLAAIPPANQDAFRQHMAEAAVGLQNNGIAIDRRAVAAFGIDTRDNIAQVSNTSLEARRVVSTPLLDQVRVETLNTLETIQSLNLEPNIMPAGRMMHTIIKNTENSLRNAGYMAPGDSTARTTPYAEQIARGTREDAEQIAAAGKLLSDALNSPEGLASIVNDNGNAFGAIATRRLTDNAQALQTSVNTIENDGRIILEAREGSQMTPEAAIASIDLLTAGMIAGRDATMGFNTEIADGESYSDGGSIYRENISEGKEESEKFHTFGEGEGALSKSAKNEFERDERETDDHLEPGSYADSTVEAHQMGISGETGLHGMLDSMESLTAMDPSYNAVGTVYISQKNFGLLEKALQAAADSHLKESYERMGNTIYGLEYNTNQAILAEQRVKDAEEEYKRITSDPNAPLTPEQDDMANEQIANRKEEHRLSDEQATNAQIARAGVPFRSEEDLERMQRLQDGIEKLVSSVSPEARRNDPIVVREDLLLAMDGAVESILANNSHIRVNELSGRSLRDIEEIEKQRGNAFYATSQEAAEAMEGRFGTEDLNSMSSNKRPDSVLGTIHIPKSEMSTADYEAFRNGAWGNSVSQRDIFIFDPNKPITAGEKGNKRGIINLAETAKTPKTLEDITLNRSDLERAFIAQMFNKDGKVNHEFRDQMIGLTENNKRIIVAPTIEDAKMLRAAAEDAQRLRQQELQHNIEKENSKLPKAYVTIKTQDVRNFVEQINASHSNIEPNMTVRNGKITIEHPEAKSVQGVERNTRPLLQAQKFERATQIPTNATNVAGYQAPKEGESIPTASDRANTLGANKMSKVFLDRLANSDSPYLEIELSERNISSVRKVEQEKELQAKITPQTQKRNRDAER